MQKGVCYQQGALCRVDRRLIWVAVLLVAGLTGCGGNSPSGNTASEDGYRAPQAADQPYVAETMSSSQQQPSGGFEEVGNGILRDTETGLFWTQSDNASRVNWHQANAFCESKGMRLPSIDEIAAIYNRPGAGTAPCAGYECKVSPLFRLTGWWIWSSTLEGSPRAWAYYFLLYDGHRLTSNSNSAHASSRALCVSQEDPKGLELQTEVVNAEPNIPLLIVNGGFEEAGRGLLRDTRTNLLWTQADNGSQVNWHQASDFCQSKGMRLPSINELAAIYNRRGAGTTFCGGFTCRVSPMFRLTGSIPWSGTLQGPNGAFYFFLTDGLRRAPPLNWSLEQTRALCVVREELDAAEAERQSKLAAGAGRLQEVEAERALSGFESVNGGLLRDTRTGLLWTQSDNGSRVDWQQANAFCEAKGMRLPSIDELVAIYNRPGAGSTPCPPLACLVSPLFRSTSNRHWSGTLEGSGEAWTLDLAFGKSNTMPLGNDLGRAFCVSGP